MADAVVRSPAVAEALRGTWLGHALHPLLTDFPLGAWMSASFLDLFGGPDARRAAQRLVGFGLMAATPTAAAGLAEWRDTAGAARRVGVVHAGINSTATVLYGSSWLARRRGAHRTAVALGVGGGLVATLGGYFGGHLTLVRKIGTADPGFGPDGAARVVTRPGRLGRGRGMSTPQQPELHRSGRGATDPASAKAAAEVGGARSGDGATGPVPEDNVPGHHPPHEQDKPEGPPPGVGR